MAELEHAQHHRSTRKLPAKVRASRGVLVLRIELPSRAFLVTLERSMRLEIAFGLVVMNDERMECIFSISLEALRSAGMIPKNMIGIQRA